MENALYSPDLICAESTPSGYGGVSVIRVSGADSKSLFKDLFFKDDDFLPRHVYYKKYTSKSSKFLDEVVAFYFDTEKSFTGESSFEIHCHGSPLVVQSILNDLCKDRGARIATPGEFSFRAYLNGKMDLVKAESIHHLIHSQTNVVREMSLSLLEGKFSNDLKRIKEKVVFALSRLEAVIDFSDQDIDLNQEKLIKDAVKDALSLLHEYLSSFEFSSSHLEGLKVSVLGPPNSGKSSLFNAFIDQDRSIVSGTEGTTRDYISESAFIDNYSFRLIDTAGLRETDQSIEGEGIAKSIDIAKKSQLILLMVSEDTLTAFKQMLDLIDSKILEKCILVKSKSDLGVCDIDLKNVSNVSVSVKSSTGFLELKNLMKAKLDPYFRQSKNLFVERQFQLLNEASVSLNESNAIGIEGHEDVMSSLLYKALSLIDEVLYIEKPEEVRDKIFNDFCLGK